MTQQELENKIKELEKQIAELKMVKVEELQSKRWKPNINEIYWTVKANGNIDTLNWFNDKTDNWKYLTDNYFKTEKEAEEYKNQIEYTARYKNYIEEHSEPLDWCNADQIKYSSHYDYTTNEIGILRCTGLKNTRVYASNEQIIWDAINEIGEDNFKKYVLGVK